MKYMFRFLVVILCSFMVQTSDQGWSVETTPDKRITQPSSVLPTPDKNNPQIQSGLEQKTSSNVATQEGPIKPPFNFGFEQGDNFANRPIDKQLFSNELEQEDDDTKNFEIARKQRGKDQYGNYHASSFSNFDEGNPSVISSIGGAAGNGVNEQNAVHNSRVGSGFMHPYQQNNMGLQDRSYEDVSTPRQMNDQNIGNNNLQVIDRVAEEDIPRVRDLIQTAYLNDQTGGLDVNDICTSEPMNDLELSNYLNRLYDIIMIKREGKVDSLLLFDKEDSSATILLDLWKDEYVAKKMHEDLFNQVENVKLILNDDSKKDFYNTLGYKGSLILRRSR